MNSTLAMLKLKDASIYHDTVVPLNIFLDYIWESHSLQRSEGEYTEELLSRDIIGQLLPGTLSSNQKFLEQLSTANGHSIEFMRAVLRSKFKIEDDERDLDGELMSSTSNYFDSVRSLVKSFSLGQVPIDAGDIFLDEQSTETSEIGITLVDLNLIDTSNCSWEHILEFRKDHEANYKLRKLRLFVHQNYVGKDKSFIEDDLQVRLMEYDNIVSDWGFKTTSGSIGMLLSSKALAGGVAGSVVSILAGAPVPALASVVGGTAIELGRIALHVKDQSFLLRNTLRDNPVSYIKYAEKVLTD